MSPRAIETLRSVDMILAEDTRHAGLLLKRLAISTPMQAFHEHNERRMTPSIIRQIQKGETVAVISDAGTPLISDPGCHLVRRVRNVGIRVIPVPGPSAVLAALTVSGLPSDRFVFEGFLAAKQVARRRQIKQLREEPRTMIFFEAPHRILHCITDMVEIFGPNREATIARELTKVYESLYSNTLEHLRCWLAANQNSCKGEIALVVSGAERKSTSSDEARQVVEVLRKYLPPRQAAAVAAELTNVRKNALYRLTYSHD